MKTKWKLNIDFEVIIESAYLLVLTVYLLWIGLQTTMYPVEYGDRTLAFLRMFMWFVLIAKVGYDKAYRSKEWIVAILVMLVFGLLWTRKSFFWMLDVPTLMVGAVYVPYKKILRIFTMVQLFFATAPFIGCLLGLTHPFNYTMTPQTATHIFVLILLIWVLYANYSVWHWLVVSGITVAYLIRYSTCWGMADYIAIHGVFSFLMVCALYIWFARKLYIHKQYKLLALMAVMFMTCPSGDFLTNLGFNVIPLLVFAKFTKTEEHVPYRNRYLWARLAILPIAGIVLLAVKPLVLTGRTLCELYEAQGASKLSFTALGVWAILLLIVMGLYRCIYRAIAEKEYNWPFGVALVAVLAFICFLGAQLVSRGAESYMSEIDSEREILEQLATREDMGNISFEKRSGLYAREIPGIQNRLFYWKNDRTGENSIFVAEKSEKYNDLLANGFLYAEISDTHAIYTNSVAAQMVLQEYDYPLKTYNTAPVELDMNELARKNGLKQSEEGSVILESETLSIWNLEWMNEPLYEGTLRVKFQIKLVEATEPEHVASFGASRRVDKESVYGHMILLEDFDEDGMATIEADVDVASDSQGLYLMLVVRDGTKLELQDMSWQRVW